MAIQSRNYRSPAFEQMRDAGAQGMQGGQRMLQQLLQGKQALAQQNNEAGLKEMLMGKTEDKKFSTEKDRLNYLLSPDVQDKLPDNAAAKFGDVSYGKATDPALKGPAEAKGFLGAAQKAYKPINDQIDASKATLDNLNLGNATGDKLALINEARLAAGSGGSKALAHMVSLLAGDPTMEGDFQKASNYLQNTPNIPVMKGPQRDSIRESVFARLPQLETQHNQTSQSLLQQGAGMAPHADYAGMLNSVTGPAQSNLSALKGMQSDYQKARAIQQGPPISAPSTANPNPTTLDKLKGFLGGALGGSPQPQQAPTTGPHGPSVIQGGTTYNWNPKSGQYE